MAKATLGGYKGRRYESNSSTFFLRKCNCNNDNICMDDSYIFCNYDAVFPHTFPHTFTNVQ
jgi:hypothetical protein